MSTFSSFFSFIKHKLNNNRPVKNTVAKAVTNTRLRVVPTSGARKGNTIVTYKGVTTTSLLQNNDKNKNNKAKTKIDRVQLITFIYAHSSSKCKLLLNVIDSLSYKAACEVVPERERDCILLIDTLHIVTRGCLLYTSPSPRDA